MRAVLVKLKVSLLEWVFTLLPDCLWHQLCSAIGGHSYTTAVLHTDDQLIFTIDPTVQCDSCGQPMSSDVYESLTDAYAMALTDEEAW